METDQWQYREHRKDWTLNAKTMRIVLQKQRNGIWFVKLETLGSQEMIGGKDIKEFIADEKQAKEKAMGWATEYLSSNLRYLIHNHKNLEPKDEDK